MKTTALIAIITSGVTFASCSFGADLIQNGNFKKDINYWQVIQHKGYVPAPKISCRNGELSFSGLSFLTKNYLSFSQAVNIKKGVKYKLSYEVKGPAGKTYAMRLGAPGDKAENVKAVWHYVNTKLSVTDSWQTIEVEFTGKFDTDSKWYKEVSEERENNRINHKNRERTPKKSQKVKIKSTDRPCATMLKFMLGSLEGQFSIRNISIQEIK